VKTQIQLAGLDDGGISGCRDLLEGSFIGSLGALSALLELLVGSTSSGFIGMQVSLACSLRQAPRY
jgi:hypothetical protein